jgi:colanic acid biosynthesis glycosyl transferase WcaI
MNPVEPPEIVVHDFSGHAFPIELSRELARRGHFVRHMHCPQFETPKGPLDPQPNDPATLRIHGVNLNTDFVKYSLLRRPVHEVRYGRQLIRRIRNRRPAVVLSGNTPLFSQLVLLMWCRVRRIPFIFWLQDVYSIGMAGLVRQRLGRVGGPVAWALCRLERTMLRRSSHVVSISDDFDRLLEQWGVKRSRRSVVENWAPLPEVPVRERSNQWATAQGLGNRPVALYSGTLGLKHNPALLLELANARPDVDVVVVSSGLGHQWLTKRGGHLTNLVLLPFQAFEDFPDVLASADVLLVLLESDAGAFSVPSKVLSYHCARRPIVAAVPGDNLAARIIGREGSGLTVDPGDHAGFIKAVGMILDDAEKAEEMAACGRAYAERTFDVRRIADRFAALCAEVAPGQTVPSETNPT